MNRLVKETALRLRTGPAFAVPRQCCDVDLGTRDTGLDGHRWRRKLGKRADALRLPRTLWRADGRAGARRDHRGQITRCGTS